MQQAHDFSAECEEFERLLGSLGSADWQRETLFKGWTVNDVLVHLHFWNGAADLSLNDPDGFQEMISEVHAGIAEDGFRATENARVSERGESLLIAWHQRYQDMVQRWSSLDPKQRVKWAGPDMSVRSSITARQMETWAHAQAVFDLFGRQRNDTDRLKNIVVLGVNTFGWSYKVRKLEVPTQIPVLNLQAPSGESWEFGEDSGNRINGSAVEFCQVVTQTRHFDDTSIQVFGDVALDWMQNAQCFAGVAHKPPEPGSRYASRVELS